MSPPSLRQTAYQHLHRKILAGELPQGHVVSEKSLAAEIGISRTPMREAIRQLEMEGVLEQVPRFGTVVRRLERQDLVELFQLREALEPYAVAQAAGSVSAEDLAVLTRLCGVMDEVVAELRASRIPKADPARLKRLLTADMGFHQLLIRASGNRRMLKILADSGLLLRIFATPRQEHTLKLLEETVDYHRRILDAVKKGDADAARRHMAAHIRASMKLALDHHDRSQLAAPAGLSLSLPDSVMAALEDFDQPRPATRRGAVRKVKRG